MIFRMKRIIILFLALLALLGANAMAEGRVSVVAANFPCYDFARQVVGDLGDVTLLIRPGVEVHSYEPSPADILAAPSPNTMVCSSPSEVATVTCSFLPSSWTVFSM